ncbi:MAG: hypothetical protein P1U89_27455 [Verrucomicrobiales bacterium]|nr:hypothetical protein [Verrucomicrobiales bacterium]
MKTKFLVPALTLAFSVFAANAYSQANTASPYQKGNNQIIRLAGIVKNAGPDSFILDYGVGDVLVEMDDYDWYREGHQVLNGDSVIVRGRVDRDPGEKTKIEAGSVFVRSQNTIYYANAADEEGNEAWVPDDYIPQDESFATFTGTVTAIQGKTFILDTTGIRTLKVNTATMPYNPTIKVGDRLIVSGKFDWNLFSKDEVAARSITHLVPNRR